jgi:hypothetical protein
MLENMKTKILLLVINIFLVTGILFCQDNFYNTITGKRSLTFQDNNIDIILSVDKAEISKNDSAKIEIIIKNISGKDIYLLQEENIKINKDKCFLSFEYGGDFHAEINPFRLIKLKPDKEKKFNLNFSRTGLNDLCNNEYQRIIYNIGYVINIDIMRNHIKENKWNDIIFESENYIELNSILLNFFLITVSNYLEISFK